MSRRTSLKNGATGTILVALGGATLWATRTFPADAPAAADPALLPRVVAVGLILCGIGIAVLAVVGRWSGAVHDDDAEGIPIDLPVDRQVDPEAGPIGWGSKEVRSTVTLLAALIVYSVAAFQLGFVTSTLTFIIGVSLLLGWPRAPRSLLLLGIFAVGITCAAYIGFFELLNVRVPDTVLL